MGALLYICEQGALIKKAGERIIVTSEEGTLLDVPLFKIERIMVFGSVSMTPQARDMILDAGIDVSFLSLRGRFKGKLVSTESKNIYLRLAQYERWKDSTSRLMIGRGILESKLKSQIQMIDRYCRRFREKTDQFASAKTTIQKCLDNMESSATIESIRGYEGMASAKYFDTFKHAIRCGFEFAERAMHPSPDPVNALLSLTYACLTNEVNSAAEAKGFEPYLGFVHGIKYGRKSLALDLVEEYRHGFGDRFVLDLINYKIVKPSDFEDRDDFGIFLSESGSKTYFRHWEKWRKEPPKGMPPLPEMIKHQMALFEKAVLKGTSYKGLWIQEEFSADEDTDDSGDL